MIILVEQETGKQFMIYLLLVKAANTPSGSNAKQRQAFLGGKQEKLFNSQQEEGVSAKTHHSLILHVTTTIKLESYAHDLSSSLSLI